MLGAFKKLRLTPATIQKFQAPIMPISRQFFSHYPESIEQPPNVDCPEDNYHDAERDQALENRKVNSVSKWLAKEVATLHEKPGSFFNNIKSIQDILLVEKISRLDLSAYLKPFLTPKNENEVFATLFKILTKSKIEKVSLYHYNMKIGEIASILDQLSEDNPVLKVELVSESPKGELMLAQFSKLKSSGKSALKNENAQTLKKSPRLKP